MGNQGCCEAPMGERMLRVEDGAGQCIDAMASRQRNCRPAPPLIPQYSCFQKVPNQSVGNVDEQPLELLTDLAVLSRRVNDAVSPYRPVRLSDERLMDKAGGPFGSPKCRERRDPVVQNLCEAFQRCSSATTPGGSQWSMPRRDSSVDRRLGVVAEVSRDLSGENGKDSNGATEKARDQCFSELPRRNLLAYLSEADSKAPCHCHADRHAFASEGARIIEHSPEVLDERAQNEGEDDGGARQEGYSEITWPDGRRYEGQFQNGLLHGHACMTWPDGRSYAGQYHSNRKHGVGVFTWPDGRRYSGQWRDGRREGRGVYTNARGHTRHGVWSEDKPMEWDPPAPEASKAPVAPVSRQRARVGGA